MGKAKKEHRARVAKRNQRIAEEKGKMQREFNKLLKAEMEKLQEGENLSIQMGDKPLNFEFVDGQSKSEDNTTEEFVEVKEDNEQ
jgi:hypothetical protein